MPSFHIFQVRYKHGEYLIDKVPNEAELVTYLIMYLENDSYRYKLLTGDEKDDYMEKVSSMSVKELIAEVIDVGREMIEYQHGYGIVAVVEGGSVYDFTTSV